MVVGLTAVEQEVVADDAHHDACDTGERHGITEHQCLDGAPGGRRGAKARRGSLGRKCRERQFR
jgi:hypothetical protein